MEDVPLIETSEREIKITVVGLTAESAKLIAQQFISWLSNSGEQEFWDCCGLQYEIGENTHFDYDFTDNKYTEWIVISEYKPEDTE
jgi:hypothetical protein